MNRRKSTSDIPSLLNEQKEKKRKKSFRLVGLVVIIIGQ